MTWRAANDHQLSGLNEAKWFARLNPSETPLTKVLPKELCRLSFYKALFVPTLALVLNRSADMRLYELNPEPRRTWQPGSCGYSRPLPGTWTQR